MNRLDTNPHCQSAIPYYYDYLRGRQEQIPEAISAHIAGCPNCQDEIQWLKKMDSEPGVGTSESLLAISHAAQMQLHHELLDQPVRCSTIKSFLPILAIPEMEVRISTPVTEHIKACSECNHDLDTLKQLNLSSEQLSCLSQIFSQQQSENSEDPQTVTNAFFRGTTASMKAIRHMMDRPDSGIVTYCRPTSASTMPEDQMFTVEVKNESTEGLQPSHIQTASTVLIRSRRLFKPVAAAAAILLIAILLFHNAPLKATDIGQIYDALKKVQNLKMTRVGTDTADPVQTIWMSRSLGAKLVKTGGNLKIFEVHNNIQKNKDDLSPEILQTPFNETTAQGIAKTMNAPWGLLPFNRTSDLPDGAVWKRVQREAADISDEQIEIYDLFWTEKSMVGKTVFYQWRCQLNSQTKRPFKVEWWRKTQQEQEYELMSFTEMTYLTEEQVRQAVIQAGF